MISNSYSDEQVLKELGARIAQYRLNVNKTQAALAKEAGISSRTLTRLEAGESVQTSNLIRVLRVLKLMDNLDALIPKHVVSPVQQLKMHGKQRKRASNKLEKNNTKDDSWSWGDDE